MSKFYAHLISLESLIIELDDMELSDRERKHLADLVDETLHHTVMDAILSQLSESDKQLFLRQLQKNDHGETWQFLNGRVDKIEDKIKQSAEELKKELHQDIDTAKTHRKLKKGKK